MVLFVYLFYTLIVLLTLYTICTWNHDYFKKRNVKCVKPLPFVGNYGPFLAGKHLVSIMVKTYNAHPDEKYVGFFSWFIPWIWIRDNELIKQVAIKDYEAFLDHYHSFLEENDPLYSNTLVCLRGQQWKEMRTRMTPAFTSSKLRKMHPFVKVCSNQLISHIDDEMKKNKNDENFTECNLKDIFTRYANDVIASVVFGLEINSFTDRNNIFYRMGSQLTNISLRFVLIYIFFNSLFPKIATFLGLTLIDKPAAKYLKDIVVTTIKQREQQGIKRNDMIDLLIDAKKGCLKEDESKTIHNEKNDLKYTVHGKKVWSDDELAAQSLIFFVAGYESVSTFISFASYELAKHPDVQSRLRDEIDSIPHNENLYESIMKMPYMDMVISECLRLHPSLLSTDRVCTHPYSFPPPNPNVKTGFKFNVGDRVSIPIRSIMRDPQYFPHPTKFDPERFSEENKGNIKPYTYIPFGIGPRKCIGMRFSLMEIKSVIFFLLLHYELSITSKTLDPYKRKTNPISLMPIDGIWVGFKRR